MTENIHALTGAYVLDALDLEERTEFEDHLIACDECRDEVASLRATVTFMGRAESQTPPASLRERVFEEIALTPQVPLPVESRAPRSAREPREPGWWRRPLAVAAAVVLFAGLATGGAIVYRDHRADQRAVEAQAQMMRIATAPDAVSHDVSFGTSHVVMSLAMSSAALVGQNVPMPAENGMVYQLWMVHADGSTAPGPTFMPDDGDVLAIVNGDLGAVTELMVTEEPDGGSAVPTGSEVATVAL